jgi:hypothetical protein
MAYEMDLALTSSSVAYGRDISGREAEPGAALLVRCRLLVGELLSPPPSFFSMTFFLVTLIIGEA